MTIHNIKKINFPAVRMEATIICSLVILLNFLSIFVGCSKPSQNEQDLVASTKSSFGSETKTASERGNSLLSPDAPIVIVNGDALNSGVFDKMVLQQMSNPRYGNLTLDVRKQKVEERVIDDFIANKLLEQEIAKSPDFALTEHDYSNALEEIEETLPNGMTLNEWATANGSTLSDLRKNLEPQIRMKIFIDGKIDHVIASEEEISEFYNTNKMNLEKVHARHILIQCDEDADNAKKQEKRQLAESCRLELLEGADFSEYAKQHSQCPSKQDGGDLGSFSRNRMVPAFSEAAFTQEIGEIGNVIETKFGFHVIEVLAHDGTNIESVREQIVKHLKHKNYQLEAAKYFEGLRSNAEIIKTN